MDEFYRYSGAVEKIAEALSNVQKILWDYKETIHAVGLSERLGEFLAVRPRLLDGGLGDIGTRPTPTLNPAGLPP